VTTAWMRTILNELLANSDLNTDLLAQTVLCLCKSFFTLHS